MRDQHCNILILLIMTERVPNNKSKRKILKKCLSDQKYNLNRNDESCSFPNEQGMNWQRNKNEEDRHKEVGLSKQIEEINSHIRSLEKTFQNELKKIYRALKGILKQKGERDLQENQKEQNKIPQTKKPSKIQGGEMGQSSPPQSSGQKKDGDSAGSKIKNKKIVQSPPRKEKKYRLAQKPLKEEQGGNALEKITTLMKIKEEKVVNVNTNSIKSSQTIRSFQATLLTQSEEVRLNRIRSDEKFNFRYSRQNDTPQMYKRQQETKEIIKIEAQTHTKKGIYISSKEESENNFLLSTSRQKKKHQIQTKESQEKNIYSYSQRCPIFAKDQQKHILSKRIYKNHDQYLPFETKNRNEINKRLYNGQNDYN